MIPLTARETPAALKSRLSVAVALSLCGFVVLLGRLWMLQISHGEEHRLLSDSNRIRLHRTQATRGTVRDRFGRVIADSRPSFDVVLVPEDSPDLQTTVENLSSFLRQSSAETQELLAQAKGRPAFQEIGVKRDVTWEELVAVETHQLDLPGVSLQITPRRSYPFGEVLAHLVGYVGEVNRVELDADAHYRMGDLIGKAGLERRLERWLRGLNGGQQVEVDALGRKLRILREVQEVPGSTVTLSIDLDLQLAAEEALEGKEGVIIALDPRTGEVLAMVSHPSYDPNAFARGIRPHEWRGLVEDGLRPLNNRAIHGQYPPGSIFKIVVATAALEEGVINPFTRISCGGGVQFGNHYFRCWKKGGHGSVDLHEAIVQSCDSYFYQVGQRLGVDAIAEWSRSFGLGAPSGIDLDNEKAGIIPDTGWKRRRFQQPWYPGETLSVAIGQGYVTVTPMQMAGMIAAVAGGARYRPQFVKAVEAPEGETIAAYGAELVETLPVKKSTLRVLRDALRDVVGTDRGTGKKARIPGVEVAGKTGTAQVVKLGKTRLKASQLSRRQRDHAWFVSYAPFDEPEIAVATLVEHADGGGGAVAAPITQAVLGAYFKLRAEREGKAYADVRSAAHFAF
jgi:penicillin-binding protein 2